MSRSTFRLAQYFVSSLDIAQSSQIDQGDAKFWHDAVGKEVASHTTARIEAETLVVLAESPVFAHVIHRNKTSIVERFKKAGFSVHPLHVRSRPPRQPLIQKPSGTSPNPLPTNAAVVLRECAASISHDNLRTALLRLARHGSKPV